MATAPRQQSGGASLQENVDLTPTQEKRMRNQLHPSTVTPTAYAADGAIDPTIGVAILTKGSAGAYTLAAPATGDDDGQMVEIIAGSNFAHVVTSTGLINDGTTGSPHNTWTAAAFKGSSIRLRAYNGQWYVVAKNLGTVA